MRIEENYPLKKLNTFGLEAHAPRFIVCSSLKEVQDLVKNPELPSQDAFILGGGSNILFTKNPDDLVIKMAIHGREIINEDDDHVWVRCGAGENWHEFVLYTLENNWGGIENLSLIPGTVGAAPMQNIGAYGVEIEQVFDHLRAVDRKTGEIKTFDTEACNFGYRESVFKNIYKNKYIICDVTFRLNKPPHQLNVTYGAINQMLEEAGYDSPGIREVSEAVIRIRQSKLPDPAKIGNSGSFFKNPSIPKEKFEQLRQTYPEIPGYPVSDALVKVPAGWLIEKCGWKGLTRDNIGVHKLQALVLVNYGGGKGEDVWKLAREIQASVTETFGIDLQPEVNII